jgi:ornithine carbamoyltransferase
VTRHLLDVDDLTSAELIELLDRCIEPSPAPVLTGRGMALLFEKPSARTRHSTEMAVVQLGGHPVYVRPDEVGLDVRETTEDVARTLACYHALIGARVFEHTKLERMAAVAGVPVVNLLSNQSHPLQAIADLLTIRSEFGGFVGRTVAWVGDYSNVARSLAHGAAMVGMGVRFICPPGYGPSDVDVDQLLVLGAAEVVTGSRVDQMIKGVDVVATDAWYSMGQEEQAEVRRKAFEGFTIDQQLLDSAGPQTMLLHCLPAHRGEEVTGAVVDGHRSRVWPQAVNRMHAARGALAWLLDQ